jgi:hypothetical protein
VKQGIRSRYWPLAAAVLAVAFCVQLLRREPAPPAPRGAHDDGETAPAVVNRHEPAADAPNPPSPPPPNPPNPGAPPDELARSVVGALPQGEREAQRLQVLEVEALVRSGRVSSARSQAAAYYERWPGGPDTARLEQLTGAHPTHDRPAQ